MKDDDLPEIRPVMPCSDPRPMARDYASAAAHGLAAAHRQHARYGELDARLPRLALVVLVEHVGEIARVMIEGNDQALMRELEDAMAVLVRWRAGL